MARFHISKSGRVTVCQATKRPCTAQPPPEFEQWHSESQREVELHLHRQQGDLLKGLKKPRREPLPPVTPELLGGPESDPERLEEGATKRYGDGAVGRQLWLRDCGGRPMAFLEVTEHGGRLELSDVEVREEYRGHGLARRLIEACGRKLGLEVVHHGGYTEAGLAAVAPLFAKSPEELARRRGEVYPAQSFVEDWDRCWPRHPFR